jgi:hypothetical protein
MSSRGRIPLQAIARYALLYLVLVGYSAIYEHFYEYQLTPLFHDMFTAYDSSHAGTYTVIRFLTPLAILPIGTKLRAAGQFIAGSLAVLLFIPIPIVFVPMASVQEYWEIYGLLWIGYFVLCSLSSLDVDIGIGHLTDEGYKGLLTVVFAIVGIGMLWILATNRVDLVGITHAESARKASTVSGLQGYLIPSYVASLGGLLLAAAIGYRRYYLIPVAVAGFLICYATIEQRTAGIMPFWIAYFYFSQKYFFRDSVTRFVVCIMAPFLLLVGAAAIIGTSNHKSVFYTVFILATYRIFSVPAIGFNLYQNFFHFNPHTYWSHITLVSKFVESPYNQPLGQVMEETYNMSSYNVSFLETDGLAAAGKFALPWICAAFGLMLVAVNSCARRLDVRMLALVMAGSSIVLLDVGIGPGLLTNGLALLAILLLLAPRRPPWTAVGERHCAG